MDYFFKDWLILLCTTLEPILLGKYDSSPIFISSSSLISNENQTLKHDKNTFVRPARKYPKISIHDNGIPLSHIIQGPGMQ